MFVRANTGWSEVILESITPEEALWIIQLQADRLHRAPFTYYDELSQAVALVAEAVVRNEGKRNGPQGIPV